jgi:hypothetical protein
LSAISFAQVPDPPFNPMTAPGAKGIHPSDHTLFWQNPESLTYNQLYFSDDSLLVANSDSSVRVLNGVPSSIYNSFQLSDWGNLDENKKYFWKVIEYNSSGNSNSPVWYFKSRGNYAGSYVHNFTNDLEGWEFWGPLGQSNWYWLNSTHTGNLPGELVFDWDPIFIGDSYFISPEFQFAEGSYGNVQFSYYEDWWSNTIHVGCAITTDNGSTWTSIWDLYATGNVGPENVFIPIEFPSSFRLGFYYNGNSNDIDFFYVDNVMVTVPLTPPEPPKFLQAEANSSIQKVSLSWNQSMGSGTIIERKLGLPTSNNPYDSIAAIDNSTFLYEDFNINLNEIYTYRVRSTGIYNSFYGNEATAYVPEVVPVELITFSSSVIDDNVTLTWMTATETNNSGFQIERCERLEARSEEWKSIGFVNGNGTTTETKSYFYKDENLSAGKYQYRLKQIDFDGTFEYSNTIEVEITPPAKFSLEQNYPNPFNPTTRISWQSPVSGWQPLKVFDVLGNEVAILVNEYKPAGKYEVEFNASKLSSGVYYYQLKTGEFSQTKKMTYLK